jgi:DNA-binding protein YbaB
MFDQLKAMGAVADLLKNQDKIKQAAERVRTRLETTVVTGEAAGGAVRARVSGTMQVVGMEIAPALGIAIGSVDAQQREQAESVIRDAINDALVKAQHAAKAAIEEEASALGLPGLGSNLGGFLPGLGR